MSGRIAGPPRRRWRAAASSRIVIRTPDQRVRVFVSSTLGELAAERRAVTAAITQLRLTPVLLRRADILQFFGLSQHTRRCLDTLLLGLQS